MKKLKFLATGLACMALLAGFSSCSDDDEGTGDTINTGAVFTNGWPKSAPGIYSITRNAEGLVTAMVTDNGDVTFEYHNIKTRADGEAYVEMTVAYSEDDYYVARMKLGGNGFVTSAEVTQHDEYGTVKENWNLGYNSDGQLNYVRHWSVDEDEEDNEDEETRATYSNGDITRVVETDNGEGDGGYSFDILYTKDEVATPIENKGNVMLFDETLHIDLDQIGIAYYAGLLGKATRHLPVGYYDQEYDESYSFSWGINENGYPTWTDASGDREYFEW